MRQSALSAPPTPRPPTPVPEGLHVGIIMDGNGRWAHARGHRRTVGHRIGARAVRRVVEAAPDLGIGSLTLYAFSSDNWKRPPDEVRTLMRLFRSHLLRERAELADQGVRLEVVGRRDRLPSALLEAIEGAERATEHGRRLVLRVAVDYSARATILEAIRRGRGDGGAHGAPPGVSPDDFRGWLAEAMNAGGPVPDVDLLIRTGGERRLSDFLLWEAAYAELVFTSRPWPEFGGDDLREAVEEYRSRERRFGALPEPAPAGEVRPAAEARPERGERRTA